MTQPTLQFEVIRNESPIAIAERDAALANPAFGVHFTDHQIVIVWEKDKGWHSAQVQPYGPILMDPSSLFCIRMPRNPAISL